MSLIKQKKSNTEKELALTQSSNDQLLKTLKVKRKSGLSAPIVSLSGGNEGELFTARFDTTGNYIAAAGMDKKISLWEVYGQNKNIGLIDGHKGAILELIWNWDSSLIYTASSDKTIGIFDTTTGALIKRFRGHTHMVSTVSLLSKMEGSQMLLSGSDDHTLRLWDLRQKNAIKSINLDYPITSLSSTPNGDTIFAACLDESIKAIDFRTFALSYELLGHEDVPTGIKISKDGNSLVSYAMDNTVRMWDIKPYSTTLDRCLNIFEGVPHGYEKNLIKPTFSSNSELIAVGCGDHTVMIFDVEGELKFKLPGHRGAVNQVDWHPKEDILLSASSDGTILIGEV